MSISLNIPLTRVPGQYIEISNSRAVQGVLDMPVRVIMLGPKLAAGTSVPLAIDTVTSPDQAKALYGRGSILAHMCEKFLAANSYTQLDVISMADNAAGVAASSTLTFTGPSTAAGTVSLMIGGRVVQVAVSAGQAASAIATAVAAAISALPDLLVTAVAAAAVVTLTSKHKGEVGNSIDVRACYYAGEALPAGVTLAIVAMSGGTANALLQPALDVIGDEWYTDYVTAYTDAANMTSLEAKMDVNFGPLKMMDGMIWASASGTLSALATLGTGRNSRCVTMLGLRKSPTPPWEVAAVYAGVGAYYIGIDPARPLQTLPLPGVLAPPVAERFIFSEREQLLRSGIATAKADRAGTVTIERAVTMYQLNGFGAADTSYLDVETLKTLALLRYDTRSYIALRFPRHKLAGDGTAASRGQAIVTPSIIRDHLIARFRQWEDLGLVENIDQFKADIIVEIDPQDPNRVNAKIPPDLVNQFRVFAGQIEYLL